MKTILTACLLLVVSTIYSQASFNTSTTNGCAPLNVNFTNTTSGAAFYNWDFGDGNGSTAANPSHSYTQTGYYQVELQAFDGQFNLLGSAYEYISVEGPYNDFYLEHDTICVGDEFYVSAYNNLDSIHVDFGDGSPLVSNTWGSADHTYSAPGNYQIDFTYFTPCGNLTLSKNIAVGNNVPVNDALLQAYPSEACPGDIVGFYTNWNYNWIIDFGDGNASSTEWDHAYASPGTYISTATVQNGCGNYGTAVDTIVISNNLPINNVSLDNFDPACPNSDVYFGLNTSANNIAWIISDGTTSSDPYFDHSFATYGTYFVEVNVTNGCGNDTTLYDTIVIDSNIFFNSAYIEVPDSVCFGEPMIFDGDADSEISYLWDFGDGGSSTEENGIYTYASNGTYNVSLTMENGCGNDTTVYGNVVVANNVSLDLSGFDVDAFPPQVCIGDTSLFIISPGGVLSNFTWDFGDGNTSSNSEFIVLGDDFTFDMTKYAYSTTGNFTASYTATNACGFTATENVQVSVGPGSYPEAALIFNYDEFFCLGAELEFQAAGGSYMELDFGDGSPNAVINNILGSAYHTYNQPGNYEVTLIVQNNCGLTDTTSEIITISGNIPSAVSTTIDANCGLANGKAVVSVSGGTQPYQIDWINGDQGIISDSLMAGLHQFTITDNNGCQTTGVATVSDQEAPTIVLSAALDVSCFGGSDGALDINLIGSSAPYNYSWSIGSNSQDINNLIAGPYEITVTDANGCVATESYLINQPEDVFLNFTGTNANCGQNNGSLTAVVTGNSGPYSYSWHTGASTASIYGLSPGVYDLSVIDANGCLYESSTTLSETNAPIILLDSIIQVGCGGSLASVYISPLGGSSPYSFLWSNNTTNEDLINVQSGTYDVMVTGQNGCSSVQQFTINDYVPSAPSICLVTVDPWANNNLIVWEKASLDPAVKSFNIYKESSQSGVYFLLANQSVDSLSQYTDAFSDPTIHAWRYKISALDSCGNESFLSSQHKTLHLTSNQGLSGDINLIWSHYVGINYSTYQIWRHTDIDGWNMIQALPNTLNSYTDNQVPLGTTSLHYYVEAIPDNNCTSTRANHNSTRSNKTRPIGNDSVLPLEVVQQNLLDMTIYPNPSTGEFVIQFNEDQPSQISIVDINGRLVYSGNLSSKIERINLMGESPGLYQVIVQSETNIITKRILLQR